MKKSKAASSIIFPKFFNSGVIALYDNPSISHIYNFYRHMKEHMDVPIDTSNMSEQELQFHYFKMHDSDGNNKLGNISFNLINIV